MECIYLVQEKFPCGKTVTNLIQGRKFLTSSEQPIAFEGKLLRNALVTLHHIYNQSRVHMQPGGRLLAVVLHAYVSLCSYIVRLLV